MAGTDSRNIVERLHATCVLTARSLCTRLKLQYPVERLTQPQFWRKRQIRPSENLKVAYGIDVDDGPRYYPTYDDAFDHLIFKTIAVMIACAEKVSFRYNKEQLL